MVIRLLQRGKLRGYRMTQGGWWDILQESVFEYEQDLRSTYHPDGDSGAKKSD